MNAGGPMATMTARPTADGRENRPPTHCGSSNVSLAGIPKASERSGEAVTATTCSAALSTPSPSTSQARALCAAVRVSTVVNDLEHTTISVLAGSSPSRASTRSAPSRFEENRTVRLARVRCERASAASAGPRWLPPIPRLTTAVIGSPVAPVLRPSRIEVARSDIRSRVACTAGTTSTPPTRMTSWPGARRAVWSAGMPSVTFTGWPSIICWNEAATDRSSARSASRARVVSVTCWRDGSIQRSPTSMPRRVARPGSSASNFPRGAMPSSR